MATSTHVCVGGPLDGKLYTAPREDMRYFEAQVSPGLPKTFEDPGGKVNDYRLVRYELKTVYCGTSDESVQMWVRHGMTTKEALLRLLQRYAGVAAQELKLDGRRG